MEETADDSSEYPSPRILLPDEKRAPRFVSWRPDRRESIAGIITVTIAALLIAWLIWPFTQGGDDINWRSDGIIVEVTNREDPRPEVTTVSEGKESYAWAFPPNDLVVDGPCNDPRFRIKGMPERGRIYRSGDELSIEIAYNAPGCREVQVVFEGRFFKGSPWFEQRCAEIERQFRNRDCGNYFEGSIPSDPISIDSEEGELALTALPGAAYSPENIEGFKLCAVTISVRDGTVDGSQAFQTVHVDCDTASDYPYSRDR